MANATGRPRVVGIVFSQFAAYHVDRCAAVARRLGDGAKVVAVEVATASSTYAWAPSGDVTGACKVVLFPGERYERIGAWRRFRAMFRALSACDAVFVGIGYNEPDVIMLAVALRVRGRRVLMMSDSKFDDKPRVLLRELGKALLLAPFQGALVSGARSAAYMRFLGFRRRPVVTGYDTVDLERVRQQGGGPAAPEGPAFQTRPFVYVGRFVSKKNLEFLLEAYHRYRVLAGREARRLLLVGGGELESLIHQKIAALQLADSVELTGFRDAPEVASLLGGGLALLLPSVEEQWGLVVNEALAFNLPVIASEAVGARDSLVRTLVNGFVVETSSVEGWAAAMAALGSDEMLWRRFVEGSREMRPEADVERFAAAVDELSG